MTLPSSLAGKIGESTVHAELLTVLCVVPQLPEDMEAALHGLRHLHDKPPKKPKAPPRAPRGFL